MSLQMFISGNKVLKDKTTGKTEKMLVNSCYVLVQLIKVTNMSHIKKEILNKNTNIKCWTNKINEMKKKKLEKYIYRENNIWNANHLKKREIPYN